MADAKLSAITELTAHAGSDALYIVDSMTGTPVSRRISITNLFSLTAGEVIVLDSGSAAAPSVGWTNTGFYESSADTVNLSLGGTSQWSWGGGVVTSVWTMRADTSTSWQLSSSTSSATAPTLVPHRGSTTTGIGGVSGTVSVITGGTNAITVSAAQASTFAGVVVLTAGSAAAPSIGWTDTGFLESAADQIGVSLGGTEQWTWGGGVVTSVWTLLAQTVQSWRLDSSVASTTNPTLIPHRQSNDTGIGGNYPNILSLITAGVEAINIDANQLVSLDKTTQDAAFINFKATADGDATSAISTNTTSGSTTHHIQIELNGTTAWIACSTTDPS